MHSSTKLSTANEGRRRRVSLLANAAVVLGLSTAVVATGGAAAVAAPGAVVARPAGTVTADALPTVQINDGVVWTQSIAGNTVYVGGNFTDARPAGAAKDTNLSARGNLLSYTLSTGVLTSWAPTTDGPVLTSAVSPDGKRLYIGGQFTKVNGSTRSRIAAFDISGATPVLLSTFRPAMGTTVKAIVATNSYVYVGGVFTAAAGVTRNRLAAFDAVTGALTAWNPNADFTVNALTLTPDGTKVIAGGQFQNVGGSAAYGLAGIDATSGALVAWQAGATVRDAGNNAGIYSLTTDGVNIYGTGFVFGDGGNLEGSFSAEGNSGALNWVESCHGDTYGTYANRSAGVVYKISHSHECGDVGGFSQTDTPWLTYRTTAWTLNATGTANHNYYGGRYKDWYGTPTPSMVDWTPDFYSGHFTGQGQAAWSIAGNSQYVVEGGEFPGVNGGAQYGLVRFAIPSIAPNKQGPLVKTTAFLPNLYAPTATSVRVAFQTNWDRDNDSLTYKVFRDGNTTTPVWTGTATSHKWDRPMLGFTDTGLAAGSTHDYQVWAIDPDNNTAKGSAVSITLPATDPVRTAYGQRVAADGATPYLPFDETSGALASDRAGYNDAQITGTVTRGVDAGPILNGGAATTFGGSNGFAVQQASPSFTASSFTLEAWFKTGTSSGGEIVGLGSAPTAASQNNSRVIYMENGGQLRFGVNSNGGSRTTIRSSSAFNNNSWHHVLATQSGAGMRLYVDGAQVASNGLTSAQVLQPSYLHVGADSLANYSSRPSSDYFAGDIAHVAYYPSALSQSTAQQHYALRTSSATPPSAVIASSCTDLSCSFDGTGSSTGNGSITGYAWNFGDGSTGSGATPAHTYAAGGSYTVTLTVTDSQGATGTTTKSISVATANVAPTASFTTSVTDLTVAVNGSASSDPDGTISSYAWTFGDGASGTGVSPSHAYSAAGTYTVTLTVTDNRGGTNSTSQSVTVTAPAIVAQDTFARSVTGGWGTADKGGPWTVTGTVANYNVAAGTGSMTVTAGGGSSTAALKSTSILDSDTTADVALDKVTDGGGEYVWISARRSGSGSALAEYRLRVKVSATGAVQLSVSKVSAGVEVVIGTAVAITGLTYTANTVLHLRMQVQGTSSVAIRGKVWSTGTEPAAWTTSQTDASSPLGAGWPGLQVYLSGSATLVPVTAKWSNLLVKP